MTPDPCITPDMIVPSYVDGVMIDLATMTPADYNVKSVARSLSLINRFNGRTPFGYSVAQHAVVVAYLVGKSLKFRALHHDDDEAFTGDIIAPIKDLFPGIRAFTKRHIQPSIDKALGFDGPEPAEIKRCDQLALRLEQRYIQGRYEIETFEPFGVRQLLVEMTPRAAEQLYLLAHKQYSGEDWR